MKDIPKTWVLTVKQFEDFRQKKEQRQNSRPFRNTLWNTRPRNTIVHSYNYCASFKINSLGPKRLLKTQNLEKKAIFPFGLLVKKTF